MIGKITVGKSFRGCLAYCLNDKTEAGSGTSNEGQSRGFNVQQMLRK